MSGRFASRRRRTVLLVFPIARSMCSPLGFAAGQMVRHYAPCSFVNPDGNQYAIWLGVCGTYPDLSEHWTISLYTLREIGTLRNFRTLQRRLVRAVCRLSCLAVPVTVRRLRRPRVARHCDGSRRRWHDHRLAVRPSPPCPQLLLPPLPPPPHRLPATTAPVTAPPAAPVSAP